MIFYWNSRNVCVSNFHVKLSFEFWHIEWQRSPTYFCKTSDGVGESLCKTHGIVHTFPASHSNRIIVNFWGRCVPVNLSEVFLSIWRENGSVSRMLSKTVQWRLYEKTKFMIFRLKSCILYWICLICHYKFERRFFLLWKSVCYLLLLLIISASVTSRYLLFFMFLSMVSDACDYMWYHLKIVCVFIESDPANFHTSYWSLIILKQCMYQQINERFFKLLTHNWIREE